MNTRTTTLTATLLTLLCAVLTMTACKEKKQSTEIIVTKQEQQQPAEPTAMHDSDFTEEIQWIGKTYTITISRRADSELPVVSDAQGVKYYDNRFTLSVNRNDGTTFYSHEFTKADFAGYVDAQYLSGNALLGLVYEEADGDNLLFAASVGEPDPMSDDYVPLVITLSRTGNLSIRRDTRPGQ